MNRTDAPAAALPKSAGHRGLWQACAILWAGLVGTLLLAQSMKWGVEADASREFAFDCDEIRTKILDRLRAHEQILRSAAAFFESSGSVRRQDWRHFAERQKTDQQLPGIQGIGFGAVILRADLAQHVQAVRAEGFPAYQVRPQGERERYAPVIFLEPFTNRNLRALGYDMLSEPVRRMAMERAQDQEAAALSGKVTLVQETDQDIQAGALMFVPVYRSGSPHDTIPQRRAALLGWVYSPYRMNDLMHGILGGWERIGQRQMQLEVFDGTRLASDTLLFDSQRGQAPPLSAGARWAMQRRVVSAGHEWTLRFTPNGRPLAALGYSKVWVVVVAGVCTSFLLAGLFFSVLNTRFQAWQMAEQLAAQLQRLSKEQQVILDTVAVGIGYIKQRKVQWANAAHYALLGYAPGQHVGMDTAGFYASAEDYLVVDREGYAQLARGGVYSAELPMKRKDGSVFWCRLEGRAVDPSNLDVGSIWTLADTTEHRRISEALRESEERCRRMADAAFEGLMFHERGLILDANQVFADLFGFATPAALLGQDLLAVLPLTPQSRETLREQFRAQRNDPFEISACRADGAIVCFETQGRSAIYGGRSVRAVALRDVTERKRAEVAIQTSLREKETLLKEIHHRVKNNLQIISSLLRLQSGQLDHPIAKAALEDTQNRVRSMALVHEHLYRSENLAAVDLAAYLDPLCRQLFRALVARPGAIRLHLGLVPLRVEIDQAIPCGLLVTELLSNALKHAFPEERAGEVRVELEPSEGGALWRLVVADDGVGLPAEFDLKQLHSLGLRLVPGLATQMGGQLDIRPGASGPPSSGTRFEVCFSPKTKSNPV